jgi:serine/threonine protein kinase
VPSWWGAEGCGGRRYYIVMELLVGGALLDRILDSPNRQFSEHQALDIMKQAARARTRAPKLMLARARAHTDARMSRAPAHPARVHSCTHPPLNHNGPRTYALARSYVHAHTARTSIRLKIWRSKGGGIPLV